MQKPGNILTVAQCSFVAQVFKFALQEQTGSTWTALHNHQIPGKLCVMFGEVDPPHRKADAVLNTNSGSTIVSIEKGVAGIGWIDIKEVMKR